MTTHRGPWIQTFTGRAFPVLDPRPEDIDPVDIAHALGMLCRYNGHVQRFYSVAEHCVLMSYAVPPEHAPWALLHDATEAYIGDVTRPLKRSAIMTGYVSAEHRLMRVICDRFDLPDAMPDQVAGADRRILLDERAALLGPSAAPWADYLESQQPLGVNIHGWDPVTAGNQYMNRLKELT
jgi:hypothetical protein